MYSVKSAYALSYSKNQDFSLAPLIFAPIDRNLGYLVKIVLFLIYKTRSVIRSNVVWIDKTIRGWLLYGCVEIKKWQI